MIICIQNLINQLHSESAIDKAKAAAAAKNSNQVSKFPAADFRGMQLDENFDAQKPTIGRSEIDSQIETIFDKEEVISLTHFNLCFGVLQKSYEFSLLRMIISKI